MTYHFLYDKNENKKMFSSPSVVCKAIGGSAGPGKVCVWDTQYEGYLWKDIEPQTPMRHALEAPSVSSEQKEGVHLLSLKIVGYLGCVTSVSLILRALKIYFKIP